MNEIVTALTLLSESSTRPWVLLILTLLISVVWLARQYVKLRNEINTIRSGEGQQNRDAVVDAMEKIALLEGKGLTPQEMEMAKARILSTIQFDKNKPRNRQFDSKAPPASTDGLNEDLPLEPTSRFGKFLSSLFTFGLFGIWGLGWGTATFAFFTSGMFDLWDWTMASLSTGEVLSFVYRITLTVLITLAVAGLGVVPTIIAALTSAWGFSTMFGVVFPNRLTDAVDRTLISLRDKNFGSHK